MSFVATLVRLFEPWASLYNNSPILSSVVMFAHLGGLLLGGGGAVAADRASLRAARASAVEQESHLRELALVHRVVLGGLGLAFVSGLLLALADVETYATLRVFWVKIGLIVLLLANGFWMRRTERALAVGGGSWKRLHSTAVVSLLLWFAVVLASTFLTAAA